MLVCRSLKLHDRKQFTEQAADEQVLVLERQDQKWTKVWPAAQECMSELLR